MTPDRVKKAQQSLHGKCSISTWRSGTEQLCLLQVHLPSDLHRAVYVRIYLIDANMLSISTEDAIPLNSIFHLFFPVYNGSPNPGPTEVFFPFFRFSVKIFISRIFFYHFYTELPFLSWFALFFTSKLIHSFMHKNAITANLKSIA